MSSAAVVKLVDFGSALVIDDEYPNEGIDSVTPGYCPPEYIATSKDEAARPLEPSFDMWALAVIVYSTYARYFKLLIKHSTRLNPTYSLDYSHVDRCPSI